ncbi:MAG: tail fiber domain-containing protein [Lachnospiraceae bacterium]|nr:tail fiber domain-containing protein [Lachnospiraceae bacterium]
MSLLMQEITLDLNDSKTYEYMYAKQYDEGRQVVFHITKDGQPFDTTDYKAAFQMKKPDGTVVFNDYDIEDGKFTVTLTNQMSICAGNHIPFQIQLIKVFDDLSSTVLTTVTGYLKVAKSVIDPDDVVSSDEFNALTHAMLQVEQLQMEVTQAETLRQENEDTRRNSEDIRISNEENRQTEEADRQTNEMVRINAEDTRCRNEETRQSNENIRNSNETVRQTNTADAIARSVSATTDCINASTDLQQKLDAHHFVLTSDKGINGGVAELDENGLVPSSQLPGYVDDVLEGYLEDSIFYSNPEHTEELAGEAGKIYVDLETNKTYRWSGSAFIVISETLALGETSSTAYRGDRGKAAYDHSQSEHARTDATKVEPSVNNGNIIINDNETSVYVHPDSGATAGSYGDASDQSPAAGESFKVPYVTLDSTGHVTEVSEHTVTLPTTSIILDDELSEESTNPIENKAVTQAINSKQNTITGAATTIASSNLTASRALVSNKNGKIAVVDTTSTELGYVHGVTSAIQTQLNNKAASNHSHSYLPLSGGTMTGTIHFNNGGMIDWSNQTILLRSSAENYGFYFGVRDSVWSFYPESGTNGARLGTSNHPWRTAHLENAVIITSDRNKKENIHYLEDNNIFIQLFMKLLPCSFTYKNTGENTNHDRTHIGFIAQDVEAAMSELGLTSLDFAGFCKDPKVNSKVVKETIFDSETGEEKEVERIVEEKIEGEYIYSLRYQEFIALITKVLQKSCKRLDDLEYRLSKLESGSNQKL